MSIASWKAEFYPVEANEVLGQEALDHSIRKWTGLLKKNLSRHGVRDYGGELGDDEGASFYVDGTTCALCQVHEACKGCPLDGTGQNCNDESSPFGGYMRTGSVVPMLNLLNRVRRDMVKKP